MRNLALSSVLLFCGLASAQALGPTVPPEQLFDQPVWMWNTDEAPTPLLALLSPPGAGYDSTNVALSTASGTAVTISRASTQTCEVSPGVLTSIASNKPCVASGSLVVEPAGTNLALRSAEMDDATWTKTGVTVTANAATAPDGTLTADRIVATAATQAREHFQNISVTSGTTYTESDYLKADPWQFVQVLGPTAEFGNTWYVNFDLVACSVTVNSGGVATASATALGSTGWCRIRVSAPALATSATGRLSIAFIASGTATRFPSTTGDGSGGFLRWGSDFETGSVATSYVPTTTASASRAAQSTSVPTPAAWASTPGKGSVTLRYCPAFSGNPPDNKILFDSRATIANGITVFALPVGTVGVDVVGNSVTVSARSAAVAWTAGQCKTIAARFTSAGCAFISVDGVETGGSCDVNAVPLSHGASLFIGSRFTAVNQALGTISSLRVCSSPDGCR